MASRPKSFSLSKRAKRILLALRVALIEEVAACPIKDANGQLLKRCQILLNEFPKTFRWGFLWGMYFFDRLTFLFGFGFRRFVNLKPEQQQKYVQRWLGSRFYSFRSLATGLRGFLMITYFSHKDVWKYIGYDPVPHVQSKIALREKLLSEASSAEGFEA